MHTDECAKLKELIELVKEASPQQTGGKWLEEATRQASPLIRDWDISECWSWADWPEREMCGWPDRKDIGIDLVAKRASDGQRVAVQCKARQLDEHGAGHSVTWDETSTFAALSSTMRAGERVFAERWIVTNGSVPLAANFDRAMAPDDEPFKLVNLAQALQDEFDASCSDAGDDDCEHCTASVAPPPPTQKIPLHRRGSRSPACSERRSARPSAYCESTSSRTAAGFLSGRREARSSCPAAPARLASRFA